LFLQSDALSQRPYIICCRRPIVHERESFMHAVITTYFGKQAREPSDLLPKHCGTGHKRLALQMLFAGWFALASSIVLAQDVTRSAEAVSGAESVVGRSTFWNSACEARPVTVTIKQQPANGTASVKNGLNPVAANPRFGTASSCVGKQVMGKQVVYRSKPGFHGGDQLVYESVSDKGERTLVSVKIEVK